LHKVLVANRGEIAVRIIRACRDLRLASVAVYSDADRGARHVRMADEACWIGAAPSVDSYLRIDRIVEAARTAGADAVHPGYGFLSENAAFAAACRDAGLLFIGPSPEAIALMGSKTEARRVAIAAGVPVVPGTEGPLDANAGDAAILAEASRIGYPLMVKAVAGGGGKGMRVVREPASLLDAIRAARSEALSAFGDADIYLERRLERPRHVEVQLLADRHGVVMPFVERECSIQRRQQKVVEESPSPVVTPELRARLAAAAASVARAAGYVNAGTIEFLLDESGAFYFLEMNTRLQVEHPITEAVTGVDLVQWQIQIAQGAPLTLDADQLLVPNGHAIECRVYAEDADAGFMPSPGPIALCASPEGPGVRNDSGVESGSDVPVFYDPLLSKLIAWGADRAQAIARMRRALGEYDVVGVRTSLPFFKWLLAQESFTRGAFHTSYLDEVLQQRQGQSFVEPDLSHEEVAAIAAVLSAYALRAPADKSLVPAAGQVNVATLGLRASASGESPRYAQTATSRWVRQARHEALRN
jgi:acetyl-CoA carboxylase biotin carboxylase subunit